MTFFFSRSRRTEDALTVLRIAKEDVEDASSSSPSYAPSASSSALAALEGDADVRFAAFAAAARPILHFHLAAAHARLLQNYEWE